MLEQSSAKGILAAKSRLFVLCCSPMLLFCGCNTFGTVPQGSAHAIFAELGPSDAFEAARGIIGESFQITEADREAGVIRAVTTGKSPTPRESILPPWISSPHEIRSLAEVDIESRETGVWVSCRVLTQRRLDTSSRLYLLNFSAEDLPNQTPLEESAGLSGGYWTTWATIGRDRHLESAILVALREQLSAVSSVASPIFKQRDTTLAETSGSPNSPSVLNRLGTEKK